MPNTYKLLVIDDDPQLRDALIEQLSLHEEFEAAAAENGSKGVQLAKEEGQIDLVIMDVGLPDIDGREAVRILRRNGFKAPIIMLTGHDTDSDTILGLEFGSERLCHEAVPLCRAACAHPDPASPTRGKRRCNLRDRALQVLASVEAAAQSGGQETPFDREGDLDPTVPLSRRRKASIARETLARGVGLQFRSHPHARDAYLSVKAKNRKRCRRSGHPCYCRRRLQAGALIGIR